MTREKLEELGWKFDSFWNNRALFTKKDEKLDGFVLFEHNGNWGIMDPYSKEFKLIYCNMSDDEIEQYIDYVNSFENIMDHPKDYTFYEYICIEANVREFITKMIERG